MRTDRFLPVLLLVAVVVAGCTKTDGPSGTSNDPELARQRVAQANQIFIPRMAILVATSGSDSNAFDVSNAYSLYQEALTYDANNLDAHFGVALTELVLIGADPDIRTLFYTQSRPQPYNLIKSLLGGQISSQEVLKSFSSTSFMFEVISRTNGSPLRVYGNLQKRTDERPFSFYQNLIETKLLPPLADAATHLSRITENPGFAFYITSAMAGIELQDSVRIDLTEIYLLLAVVQGLSAEGSFAVSYNIDYTGSDSAAVVQAWQAGSSFLSLRSGGAQRMRDTKTNLVNMGTSVQSGIAFLLSETPHPGLDPIRFSPQDVPTLNEAKLVIDTVKMAISRPWSILGDFNGDGSEEALNVNLASFFDNAITNIKQKLPTYTVETERTFYGTYDPVLVWQASSFTDWIFPDPSFNGILPGMTDAQFKSTFGFTAGRWTQRWRIELGGGVGPAPVTTWQVLFTPDIDVSACYGSSLTWCCQPIAVSSDGFFYEVWSGNEPGTMIVYGTMTPTGVSATFSCYSGSPTGTLSAAWNGSQYVGTFSFNGSSGSVTIQP